MKKHTLDHKTQDGRTSIPYWKLILDQSVVTPEILTWHYEGSGTQSDPYVVTWIENDPRDPMQFSRRRKWFLTILVAIVTTAVALISSAYSATIPQIRKEFHVSTIVASLGISLYVLGFAIGPLLWGPFSELYGRQRILFISYAALTAFNAGAAGAKNIETLLILRFFAGAFGASPLTNSGATIADMFEAEHRGIAMALFGAAPSMGPVLGPIIGGFLGEAAGWRWVQGLMAAFSGVLWILAALLYPETYAPVLLRRRAKKLSQLTGKEYRSKLEIKSEHMTAKRKIAIALYRPWVLFFYEPIVMIFSIYLAIVYGTLYLLFGAFPVVYQQERGWSEGVGGLSFLGVLVGTLCAIIYNIMDNTRYVRVSQKYNGVAPPEARLPSVMVGAVAIPIGLFWFAWTNSPSIHWMVSITAGGVFAFGMILAFLCINYLVDAYTIYAASVIASTSVLRSLFAAAFPLFTPYMYANLGIHWASSIPAFLSLAFAPFPFVLYKYGAGIRKRCKFAAEADALMQELRSIGVVPVVLNMEGENDIEKDLGKEDESV